MRDFVVIISKTKYDAKAHKFLCQYQNINVLVGNNDSIEAAKKEITDFLKEFKGHFKSVFKVQAD